MTVYLVFNAARSSALATAREAAQVMLQAGITVLVDSAHAWQFDRAETFRALPPEQALQACDVVVSVGGDGTMLHTARRIFYCEKPLLGVNTGRLGFLTIVENDELDKLARLPKGEYTVEHRSVLSASCKGGLPEDCLSLNDIVLFKRDVGKPIDLHIYCDDVLVSRFRGDGVIFATPTGSTAYSMSAGGPILDARLGGILVTQISAHVLRSPPMVFAPERTLRVDLHTEPEAGVILSCDGQYMGQPANDAQIIIRQARHTVPLVQFEDADQLKSIDKKLKGR